MKFRQKQNEILLNHTYNVDYVDPKYRDFDYKGRVRILHIFNEGDTEYQCKGWFRILTLKEYTNSERIIKAGQQFFINEESIKL